MKKMELWLPVVERKEWSRGPNRGSCEVLVTGPKPYFLRWEMLGCIIQERLGGGLGCFVRAFSYSLTIA